MTKFLAILAMYLVSFYCLIKTESITNQTLFPREIKPLGFFISFVLAVEASYAIFKLKETDVV